MSSSRRLALLGASGHGKVVADLAEVLGYKVVFFDKSWPSLNRAGRWEVRGDMEQLIKGRDGFLAAVVAIGNNQARAERQAELEEQGISMATLVHPSAQVSGYAKLAAGSVIFANAVVNTDAVIGKGAIINTAATVDHDAHLGDFVHISPGAHLAGNVTIGNCSWVGIGASVHQGIVVGAGAIIGAGAAVVSDVASGSCVVGVPARPIAHR